MIDATSEPLPRLPVRRADTHKGDYGRGLIVGGSLGMAGAPALAAMACLRSGSGLVAVAAPRCVQPTVAAFHPAWTTHALADDGEGVSELAVETLLTHTEGATAVAIGPGLGRGAGAASAVGCVWSQPLPVVIDADGLNALASLGPRLAKPLGPRVLTPHAGEFARLAGRPLADQHDDAERRDAAAKLARSFGPSCVVLLKGARTVVTDGDRFAVNTTGNPGMATGGVGDVLTGIITGLLCQGLDAFDATRLGAHVHGLAGDLAAAKLGQTSLIATDLIDELPAAFCLLSAG
ncbi:MAG: NAD(P)H-hydrate dehydratase [Planctomycetota bacterium]